VHRWQVGDVDIVRLEDLDFAVPSEAPVPSWCVPQLAPSVDEVGIAFSALAIAADGLRIVVDPWLANDFPRVEPDAAEHAARLLGELGDAGFPADEVDVVVNTHLDGIGWNTRPAGASWQPSFPNARYLYPADEVAALDAGIPIHGGGDLAVLRTLVELELVAPPRPLTPTVTLVDAPGHNDGHLAVRIEDGGDLAVYAGHLFLSPFHVADPSTVGDDEPVPEVTIATRRAILDELADRDGLLLTTLLGGPGGGRVAREGAGFLLRSG
jgi:glyoxylase-like metal-dependent hydrolase (beta-lactamase superfamily II)